MGVTLGVFSASTGRPLLGARPGGKGSVISLTAPVFGLKRHSRGVW